MANATLRTRTLEIDSMTGDACVQKVTAALQGVAGVSTQGVRVGSATIQADDSGCAAACAAINTAGYRARESQTTGSSAAATKEASQQPATGELAAAPGRTGTASTAPAGAPVQSVKGNAPATVKTT